MHKRQYIRSSKLERGNRKSRSSGPEHDLDGARVLPVDGGLYCSAVVVESEFMCNDYFMGQQSSGKNVKCPIHGMAVRAACEAGR
jgi:hypothetical protein